jgi:hypothetical protein
LYYIKTPKSWLYVNCHLHISSSNNWFTVYSVLYTGCPKKKYSCLIYNNF